MAPADDGGRELGADLQVDEAAAAGEAQRPPLHLPAQVNSNQTNQHLRRHLSYSSVFETRNIFREMPKIIEVL